jgi:hypothetical protein
VYGYFDCGPLHEVDLLGLRSCSILSTFNPFRPATSRPWGRGAMGGRPHRGGRELAGPWVAVTNPEIDESGLGIVHVCLFGRRLAEVEQFRQSFLAKDLPVALEPFDLTVAVRKELDLPTFTRNID